MSSLNYDQELERMYHPENFEPDDVEERQGPFDLDIEMLFGLKS